MKAQDINQILNIKESFEMPGRLFSILLSDDADKYFRQLMDLDEPLNYDWFTNYFQEEHADRNNLAQDYTPTEICDLLARIVGKADTVADVCAGTGGLTIAMWNNNPNAEFVCYEYSNRAIPLLLFNLALRNVRATVIRCDVLTGEEFDYYKVTPGDEFSKVEKVDALTPSQVDAVISNPPYSMKYDPKKDDRFPEFKDILPTNFADYVFVHFALSILKDNGKAGFLLPHGVLFRAAKEKKNREYLIDNNIFRTVISLPANLFLNTSIPVAIIELQKGRDDGDILFVEASGGFVKDKKKNKLEPEHIKRIYDAYSKRCEEDRYAHLASKSEIVENGYNLNIPRYVDTTEPEEEIDIWEVLQKIEESKIERETAEAELLVLSLGLHDTICEDADKEFQENLMRHIGKLTGISCESALNFTMKPVKLTDIATVERAKNGKKYPAGTIYTRVSAPNGQVGILQEEGPIESKYAAVMINDKTATVPLYVYYAMQQYVDDFLAAYAAGSVILNIQVPDFKHFQLYICEDYATQLYIAALMWWADEKIQIEENQLENLQQLKKSSQQNMFA